MNRREVLVGGVAAVLVDPRGCAGRARHPLALVTADTEAHVVVLSLETAAVRGRVRTLEHRVAAAAHDACVLGA